MVDTDFDSLSLDLPLIDSMFNISSSPASKAMICDDTSPVPFLTLDRVILLDPLDTPLETLPPLQPTPEMFFNSIAPDQAPCYHLASPYRRGGRNSRSSGSSISFHHRQRRFRVIEPTFLATHVSGNSNDKPWQPEESADQPLIDYFLGWMRPVPLVLPPQSQGPHRILCTQVTGSRPERGGSQSRRPHQTHFLLDLIHLLLHAPKLLG